MNRLHANQRQCSAPREPASSARTGSKVNVFLKGAAQPIFFIGIEFGKGYEIAIEHVIGFSAQDISKSAGHARAEIQAERPEDDSDAASHVFAAVLADAFDNGKRTTVADSETLSSASGNKELPGSGAIEHGVSGKNVTAPGSCKPRGDGDGAARKTFSNVIVGLALEPEG